MIELRRAARAAVYIGTTMVTTVDVTVGETVDVTLGKHHDADISLDTVVSRGKTQWLQASELLSCYDRSAP